MIDGKRIVAMIPARLGSQRVPRKNLRLLAGKPLIAWAIEAAKDSGVFDEVYVNSEADVFADVAARWGVRFYKRPADLASNAAINDAFADDFVRNVEADVLVQLLPTSPLITPEEIREFVERMVREGFETLVSVEDHRIACVFEGEPVNFSTLEPHRSSQTMTPVQSYATVLMAWTYDSWKRDMAELGCAYHGGSSRIGYHVVKGLATIDIDNEEDFHLAEVALAYRADPTRLEPRFWEPDLVSECEVPAILKRDGVLVEDFDHENLECVNVFEIIEEADDDRSWCRRVVNTENNSATLISQLPGEGNRLHYHPEWNEWWYIVKGTWRWEIEGTERIVRPGDVVFMRKGRVHCITAVGDEPAVRLAVSKDLVPHVYPEG
ncbi:MAG: cupin domain-containing protein [Coriobacteriia bacterium]